MTKVLDKVTLWRPPKSLLLRAHERNVTALTIEDKLIIIDPGVAFWQRDLLRHFPGIDEIWLTHAHPDHCATVCNLQSQAGCKLFCSGHEKYVVQNPASFLRQEYKAAGSFKDEIFPRCLQPLASVIQHAIYGNWPPAKVDATFETLGMNRYGVQVLKLPGHTEGAVGFCLSDGDLRILLIGDLMQTRAGSEAVLAINLPRSNLDQAMSSLKTIKSMRPDILVPAHGEFLRGADAIAAAIEKVMENYQAYGDRILQFIETRQEIPSLAQIAKSVVFPWPPNYTAAFTQRRALVLAVLKSLCRQGRVSPGVKGLERVNTVLGQNESIATEGRRKHREAPKSFFVSYGLR
ncbi:MAG: MBL fold metallo-hydrolase [bacterium]